MKSQIGSTRSSDGSYVAEGWQEERWTDRGGRLHIAHQKIKNHRNYRRRGEGFPEDKLTKYMKAMVIVEALLIAYVLGTISSALL